MRLIDADKLIEICDKGWRLGGAINTKIYHTVDASDIRSQPTVKAITIEWMKSWAMKNWVKSKKCEYDIIVSKMIEDWEEENETD